MIRAGVLGAGLATALALAPAAEGAGTAALGPAPPGAHSVPGAAVRVSPTAIPAGQRGRRIEVTFTLRRAVSRGELALALPARWLSPSGRTPYVRAARLTRAPRQAALRRSGRVRAVLLQDAPAGSRVTLSLDGLNPPAGTYELGLLAARGGGRLALADRARVVVRGRTLLPGVVRARSAPRAGGTRVDQTFGNGSDPGIAFDQNGDGWYSFIAFDDNGSGGEENGNHVVVNRLAHGGTAFRPLATALPISATDTFQDKPLIRVDTGASSPHRGRIYVVWTENLSNGGQNVVVSFCDTVPAGSAHCDDPGAWSAPARITVATGSYLFADAATAPTGDVYVVWWNYADDTIEGARCAAGANCGQASGWTGHQVLHTLNGPMLGPQGDCPTPAADGGRVAPVPSIDIAQTTGRIFVALSDYNNVGVKTTRCTGAATDKFWDVLVGSSATTTLPTTFTSAGDAADRDFFMPWLDVDQSTGTAATAFYRSNADSGVNARQFARYAEEPVSSVGAPSGSATELATADSDYSVAHSNGFDYGDYDGVAAAGGKVYPVWTDGRDLSSDGEVYFRKLAPGLGAEQNLTHDTHSGESTTSGAETAIDVSGTRVLAGANQFPGAGMLAFLSDDDGASFGSPVLLPLTATLSRTPAGTPAAGNPPASTPATRDTRKPRISFRIPSVQRLGRHRTLLVFFRSDENARVRFSSTLSVAGAARVFRVHGANRSARANRRLAVRLRLTRRGLRAARRALRRHRRVVATIRATATDAAGNRSSTRHRTRIRR